MVPGFYLLEQDEYDPSTEDFVPQFLLPAVAKLRTYKHFAPPLKEKERSKVFDFSSESQKHRFLPLLGFTDTTVRFERDGTGIKKQKTKERPIRFAGHRDAFYLQAYAAYLNEYYESSLLSDGISDSVLAYRRGGSTNIHHAKSLFCEIKTRKNCAVLAMDISGFFDNINHLYLRDQVCGILDAERLTGHHLTV